jgi:hypothetical protein
MRTRIALSAALAVLAACRAEPPAGTAPGERPFDIGDLAAAGAAEAALGRLAQPRDWVAAEARSGGLAAAHLAARADALEALAEYTRPRAQPGR